MNWYIKRRDKRRIKKIFQVLDLPQEGKVIDISCGGGRLLKTIENHYPKLDLYGVDITSGYLAQNPELSHITFSIAEADELPFKDLTFDVTLCSFSMHHYPNIQSTLKEMNRVTRPDGVIYIADFSPKNTWSQYIYNVIGCKEPYHFEKFYTKDELKTLLEKVQCKITESYSVGKMPRIVVYKINNSDK